MSSALADAMAELLAHVAAMDRGEAYRRMCQAEDEIRRLEAEMEERSAQEEWEKRKQATPWISSIGRFGGKMLGMN